MTTTYNITLRAGNSGTVVNSLGFVVNLLVGDDPLDCTGNAFVFRAIAGNTQVLRKDTSGDVTLTNGTDAAGDPSTVPNLVTVPFTVADSRLLEAVSGPIAYDLERRFATTQQQTMVSGSVFVEPGANDD